MTEQEYEKLEWEYIGFQEDLGTVSPFERWKHSNELREEYPEYDDYADEVYDQWEEYMHNTKAKMVEFVNKHKDFIEEYNRRHADKISVPTVNNIDVK